MARDVTVVGKRVKRERASYQLTFSSIYLGHHVILAAIEGGNDNESVSSRI